LEVVAPEINFVLAVWVLTSSFRIQAQTSAEKMVTGVDESEPWLKVST
jgi:hypothetical protein